MLPESLEAAQPAAQSPSGAFLLVALGLLMTVTKCRKWYVTRWHLCGVMLSVMEMVPAERTLLAGIGLWSVGLMSKRTASLDIPRPWNSFLEGAGWTGSG